MDKEARDTVGDNFKWQKIGVIRVCEGKTGEYERTLKVALSGIRYEYYQNKKKYRLNNFRTRMSIIHIKWKM